MTPKQAAELEAIREVQADLRLKLSALGMRIREMEEQVKREAAQEPAIEPPARLLPVGPPPLPRPVVPPPLPDAPPPATARIPEAVGPPSEAPSREAPAPPPLPSKSVAEDGIEMHFGRVWLVRIGIVILLTGIVFLGNFAWQEVVVRLGAGGKLALVYLAGIALAGLGALLSRRREQMRGYANVLTGGGLATIYYATYAAHFVASLRVISSPVAGGALLLMVAAGIIWMADRRSWEAVATVTTALAFYTAAINPHGSFALFSNLVLSLIAITLFVRRSWRAIPFVSLAGCYLGFVFWRFHQTGSLLSVSVDGTAAFAGALVFPLCYWLVFSVATFLGRERPMAPGAREVFLTLNNGAFYGLAAPVFAGTRPGDLWLFTLGFGVVLLGLSQVARRVAAGEKSFDATCLTQGLALVSLGLLLRFSGYHAALVFALQSAALLKISTWRHGRVLQVFSGLTALAAAWFALEGLAGEAPHSALTAAGVAGIFVVAARMFKASRRSLDSTVLQWRPGAFVALAALLVLGAILTTFHGPSALCALVAAGVVLPAGLRWHRMPELALAGEVFAMAAVLQWLSLDSVSPVLPCALAVLSGLFHMHWWQRSALPARLAWEALHAVATATVLLVWTMSGEFSDGRELLLLGAFALLLPSYACLMRLWSLLFAAQVFSGFFLLLFPQVHRHEIGWPLAVTALAFYSLQPGLLLVFLERMPPPLHRAVRILIHVLGGGATLSGILAAFIFVPPPWTFLVLSVGGFAFFLRFLSVPSRALRIHAAVVAGFAGLSFLQSTWGAAPPAWHNAIGLLLPLVAQRMARETASRAARLAPPVQSLLICAGILGLWLLLGKAVAASHQGFLLTVSWSVFAALVLAAGFLLKERTYRLLGLGILGVAVARIFLVDVWQLDTIYRILSFLILGTMLLATGFLYNRFAGAIRRLL